MTRVTAGKKEVENLE